MTWNPYLRTTRGETLEANVTRAVLPEHLLEFLPESLWTNPETNSDVSAPGARALCQPGCFESLCLYDRERPMPSVGGSQAGRGWSVPEEWKHMAAPCIRFPHQCHIAGLFLPEKGQNQLWE